MRVEFAVDGRIEKSTGVNVGAVGLLKSICDRRGLAGDPAVALSVASPPTMHRVEVEQSIAVRLSASMRLFVAPKLVGEGDVLAIDHLLPDVITSIEVLWLPPFSGSISATQVVVVGHERASGAEPTSSVVDIEGPKVVGKKV